MKNDGLFNLLNIFNAGQHRLGLDLMRMNESGRAGIVLLLLLVLAGAVFLGMSLVRVGGEPVITITPRLAAIGKKTEVAIKVEEPKRGLSNIHVELIQGDKKHTLAEGKFEPAPAWKPWEAGTGSDEIKVEVGKTAIPDLLPGTATIRVTAERAGTLLRSPDAVVKELSLPVKLVPPSLQVLSAATYASQGGSEAVVYRVSESAVLSGVRVGDRFFKGFPLPGGAPGDHFVIFGVPFDLIDPARIRLVAADEVDNEAVVSFVDRFFPKPVRTETLKLEDAFLARVVPEIMSRTPELQDKGNLLDNYLQINGELRKRDAQELTALAGKSLEAFQWHTVFRAMPNAKVMSAFADRRSYEYQGKIVDQQVHLGFDLASSRGVAVPSANDGIVVLARYFGIYGNAVVVDHGFGLMSLYGHLSSIDVKEGQPLKQGEAVGRSGQTGLAGGDHLHFSMLIQGLPVNPVEWWDAHWIQDRIARKLGAALPFTD